MANVCRLHEQTNKQETKTKRMAQESAFLDGSVCRNLFDMGIMFIRISKIILSARALSLM